MEDTVCTNCCILVWIEWHHLYVDVSGELRRRSKKRRWGSLFSNFAVPLCHTLGNPSSSQLQTPSWRLPGVVVRARTSLKKRRVVLWQHKSILISDSEIDYPSSPCLMHPFLRPPPLFWLSLNFTILGGRASGGSKRTEEIKKIEATFALYYALARSRISLLRSKMKLIVGLEGLFS